MEVKIGILLLTTFVFSHAHGISHGDVQNEMDELRAMLAESRDQNRRLEQQMSRLKLVWTGLEKMCEVLLPPCACENNSGMSSTTKQSPHKPHHEPPNDDRSLRILSVTSSGNETGEVTLSVTYTAPATHTTDWFLHYVGAWQKGNMVRTTGKTTKVGGDEYKNTLVTETQQMVALMFYLYSENETASASFNTNAIGKATFQTVPEYKSVVLKVENEQTDKSSTFDITSPVSRMNSSYVADPITGELRISFVLNKTYAALSERPYIPVYIVGLMKTDDAPSQYKAYTVYDDADDVIEFSTNPVTRSTSRMVITLRPPLTERGGILTVDFPHEDLSLEGIQGDILNGVSYSYVILILPLNSTELIPENTVALYDITEKTLVVANRHTISCVAMGNPTPVVQVFREYSDGRRKRLQAEVSAIDKWIQGAYYTLDASDKKTPGTYVCRAESGTAVAEKQTDVVVFEPVKFDDARTAVIKNNSKKVVFGCKAKSSEKPQLEFRLYDQYGPDLALMEDYANLKVSEFKAGKTASRIQLTISPPNSDIHTVYCVSRLHGIEEYRKLELFPGIYPGWNYILYDQFRNSTQSYNENSTYPYFSINSTLPSYNHVSLPLTLSPP